jgi:hypothetical protein
MRTLAFVIVCLISWPALAFDLTIGDTVDCTRWLQERDKVKSFIHGGSRGHEMPRGHYVPEMWLIGFIEGYSWACLKDKPLGSGLDQEAVFERADGICKSKEGNYPLHGVAVDLVKQLDPQHSEFCSH